MKRFSRIGMALAGFLALSAAAFAANPDIGATLQERGFFMALVLVYVAGVAVSLTPCVYPMIPITLSIIGARSAESSPMRGFLRSLVFVLGIAVIYTVLGLFVAKSTNTVGFLFQNKAFLVVMALIFFGMGLSMMGLFNVQVPPALAAKFQSVNSGSRGGLIGAFLLGITTGVVASPCGSPVLISVLTLAGRDGRPFVGGVLLFAYAMGIGLLFLFLGTFPAFLKKVPKSGVWMEDVKKFLGLLLIGAALYYLGLAIPAWLLWLLVVLFSLGAAAIIAIQAKSRASLPKLLMAWRLTALLLVIIAVAGAFELVKAGFSNPTGRIQASSSSSIPVESLVRNGKDILLDNSKFAAMATAATATTATESAEATATAPELAWETDEKAALARAQKEGKPVIIDFGAAWCAACKELEKKTFPVPEVAAVLKDFVRVRIDCTEATDENTALQQKYGVKSLPTVILIDKTGKVSDSSSLYTFEEPAPFIDRLKKVM
jgi:thiol:disulfide interchange protein DsbD